MRVPGMKVPFGRTLGVPLAGLVWVAGCAVIWWMIPVGPRDGWQPPADEFPCGFLKDGRTLLTTPRSASGDRIVGTPATGPLRLWDVETGRLRAHHFGPDDVFHRVIVLGGHDLIHLEQRLGETEPDRHTFRLRLIDARAGTEVAAFTCHVPADNVWWVFTPDARTTAFVTYDNNEPRAELHDVASGRLLHSLPGCREVICFSPDGQRFAAVRESSLVVFEVATGREIACLTTPHPKHNPLYPKEFSADGNLLLDSHCNVWDLTTGRCRFQVPRIYYNSSVFTPDGQSLVVVAMSGSESYLAFYDVITGEEQVERRVPLTSGESPGMHLSKTIPDGRFLLATGTPQILEPSDWERWLATWPGLRALGTPRVSDECVVIETRTGRETTRCGAHLGDLAPDGQILLTHGRDWVYHLWDVPASKPLRWTIPAIAVWSLALGLVVFGIVRRSKKVSPAETVQPALHS